MQLRGYLRSVFCFDFVHWQILNIKFLEQNFVRKDEIRQAIVEAMVPVNDSGT